VILLDTNVLSEPIKARPDVSVVTWLDAQAPNTLYLSSTSLAELLLGVELLPQGARRNRLAIAIRSSIERLFGTRILPFDAMAAEAYPAMIAAGRRIGRPIQFADAQIAAVASVHGCIVATRDQAPFVAAGIPVINPWTL
jgi:predicted nucleic acid-binding protein